MKNQPDQYRTGLIVFSVFFEKKESLTNNYVGFNRVFRVHFLMKMENQIKSLLFFRQKVLN